MRVLLKTRDGRFLANKDTLLTAQERDARDFDTPQEALKFCREHRTGGQFIIVLRLAEAKDIEIRALQ